MKLIFKTTRVAAVVIFLSLVGLTFSVRSDEANDLPREARETIYHAQQALKEKKYDHARTIINDYLRENPRAPHAVIYLLLGNSWFNQDNPTAALESYQQGLAVVPDDPDLHRNCAIACYQTGQYLPAGEHFFSAYNMQEASGLRAEPELLYKAATAYYQGENFTLAEKMIQKLIANNDAPPADWLILLVNTQIGLKSWAAAETTVGKLLEAAPLSVEYWELSAHLNINRNRYREAASALEIAYQIKSPDAGDWKNLADIYLYIDAPLKAAACLEKYLKLEKNIKYAEQLAEIYARALRFEKAVDVIQETINAEPTPARHLTKGMFLYRALDTSRAAEAFQTVINQDGENPTACLMLGLCAIDMKNWERASQALNCAASSEDYRSWAQGSLAIIGDLIEAE